MRKGLGNESSPKSDPQPEFISGEENREFQGCMPMERTVYTSVYSFKPVYLRLERKDVDYSTS